MRYFIIPLLLVAILAIIQYSVKTNIELKGEGMTAPVAKQKLESKTIHGVTLEDNYAWMQNRDSKEVLDHLKAENVFTESYMKDTEELQTHLYDEMVGRIQETDSSYPVKKGDYYYYSRTEKGKQYPIYCRKFQSVEADEEIVLDVNELAEGHDYFSLGALTVNPSHQYLAYSSDVSGAESYTLVIKDLKSGELLKDKIENTGGSVEWAEVGDVLLYNTLDEAKRPYKLYKHVMGEDASQDVLLYHEEDDHYFLSVYKTKDRKYFILDLSSKDTTEAYFLKADNPDGEWSLLQKRVEGMEYSVSHYSDSFFIVTNENAQNFKIVKAPVNSPGRENWEDFLAHRPEVRVEGIEIFETFAVIYERENGLSYMNVHEWESGDSHRIRFDEEVYHIDGNSNPEYSQDFVRLTYTSLVTPSSVIDYFIKGRRKELRKELPVLGSFNKENYATERIYATSADSVRVPISIVYKKDLVKDGQRPFFLYGYGSYGISIDPTFSSNRLSLLDRGFVFGIAHIRGGGDLGRPWYEDGKLMKKENTFADFIASAEKVIAEGYTSAERLVISGGSAGGMLMGAVTNKRPDLFAAAIFEVPFVDVMNTMLDDSLPLTVTEYDEWGNPNEEDSFKYMLSYSPYDNIQKQDYPPMLITGGLNDPRVQYWEPAKWVAKVRELKTNDSVTLLKMNMGAGHGGASGRYDYLKEIALNYAFFLKVLEMV